MRLWFAFLAFALLFLSACPATAADPPCPPGHTCVPAEDMKVFVQLLRDHRCRAGSPPSFKLDPIQVVVDDQGRVFATGADPKPYTLEMAWCNYQVTSKGNVNLWVAKRVPPEGGLRFRLKPGFGVLVADMFTRDRPRDAIDVGALLEGLYYRELNLNAWVGMRSVGVAVGFDLTRNVTFFAGYALAYDGPRHNPFSGLSVALW